MSGPAVMDATLPAGAFEHFIQWCEFDGCDCAGKVSVASQPYCLLHGIEVHRELQEVIAMRMLENVI